MSLIDALRQERAKLEAEIQKVNRMLVIAGDQVSGKVSAAAPVVIRKKAPVNPLATVVRQKSMARRWAKEKKLGKAAVAKATQELLAAQKALQASHKK